MQRLYRETEALDLPVLEGANIKGNSYQLKGSVEIVVN